MIYPHLKPKLEFYQMRRHEISWDATLENNEQIWLVAQLLHFFNWVHPQKHFLGCISFINYIINGSRNGSGKLVIVVIQTIWELYKLDSLLKFVTSKFPNILLNLNIEPMPFWK